MTDWDSPNRSRSFLAAALAVGAFGAFISWNTPAYETVRLEANVDRSLGQIDGRADSTGLVAVEAGPSQAAPAPEPADAGEPEDAELRDAVASAPQAPAAMALSGARGVFPGGASAGRLAPASPNQAAEAARAMSGAAAPPSAFAEALEAVSGKRAPAPAPEAASAPADAARSAEIAGNRRLLLEWVARAAAGGRSRGSRPAAGEAGGDARRSGSSSLLIGAKPLQGAERIEKERAARRAAARAVKPLSLTGLLGRALRPPRARIGLPRSKPWNRARPAYGPDGKPLSAEPFTPGQLDALDAPDALKKSCAKKQGHWHADRSGGWWHDGGSWGRLEGKSWAWVEKDAARWWAWTTPEARPVMWHQKRWWLEAQGYWFLMHDGEPWGYWFMDRWGQEGFEHVTGRQLMYSADEKILAVVTPGRGAVAYDAKTGAVVGSWTEDQLPARLRPRQPPQSLPQPR